MDKQTTSPLLSAQFPEGVITILNSSIHYRCKIKLYSILLSVFLVFGIISSATAQENFATFPALPSGYTSIKVFDNQQRYVGRILPEKRYWVSIDRIPAFLQKAVVAVEDSRFYEHGGIDVRGIAR